MDKRKILDTVLVLFYIVAAILLLIFGGHLNDNKDEEKVQQIEETKVLSFKDSVQYNPLSYITRDVINDSIIKYIEEGDSRHIVTATVYNPVVGQCDSTPLVTADRSVIDLEKLNSGNLKWIAISRELREYYKYGSTVRLTCPDNPEIDGLYEVHDTMNSRFTRYIDILVPEDIKTGKWKNVLIEKV